MSDSGPPVLPMEQQDMPEDATSTFSKIVATCLHDLEDFSDVWYPLTQSDREDTPHTLAGMCLKALLNDALKNEQVKEQMWKIVAENEPIPLSKAPYLLDHPELLKERKIQIQLPIQGIIGIEIRKSKGRLLVKRDTKTSITLAEFLVGKNFELPLYYAQHATELATDFRIYVLGNQEMEVEEDEASDDVEEDEDDLDQNRRRGVIQRVPDDVLQNDEQLGVAVIRRHLIGIINPLPPPPIEIDEIPERNREAEEAMYNPEDVEEDN